MMRRLMLVGLLAAATTVIGSLAGAGSARAVESASVGVSVVYPTGLYPQDVQNVQAAVDQGGTVVLKARSTAGVPTHFNFGPPAIGSGSVNVHRSTEIIGERTSDASTTIDGGWDPIQGFAAVTAAVRDIDFNSPFDDAIVFIGPATANTEITGNRISHLVGRFRSSIRRGTTGEAIVVFGGRIVIDDNLVDHVDAARGTGISELGAAGPAEVMRNRVSGTNDVAIECSSNAQAVRIEDNVLQPGLSSAAGFGIEVNGSGAYTIERNEVLVESPAGIGIWALGFNQDVTAPVIERNHVVLAPTGTINGQLFDDGIDLAGRVSHAYVGQNKIEGAGFSAFSLFDLSFNPPSDLGWNTFVGNNIAGVDAALADVFLDVPTHDTVLKGQSGTVIDLGTNNFITGFTKNGASGSGPQVSEAVHLRNQAKQDAEALSRPGA